MNYYQWNCSQEGLYSWLITSFIGSDCLQRQRHSPLPHSKQKQKCFSCSFWSWHVCWENHLPSSSKPRKGHDKLSCFHLGWVMRTVLRSRLVVSIIDICTWMCWGDRTVWRGEAGARNWILSSDTLLNPIALLVKSCKEMSPHDGLTAGINWCSPPPMFKSWDEQPTTNSQVSDLMV